MRILMDPEVSGFPWLEQTGTVRVRMAFASLGSITVDFGDANALDVEIIDEDGNSVATGSASTSDSIPGLVTLEADIDLTGQLDVKAIYRVHWTGTLTTEDSDQATVNAWHDAWATPSPVRDAPLSSAGLAGGVPALRGQDMSAQIGAAWFELCAWITAQRKGALVTIASMVGPLRSLALSKVYEAKAAHGSTTALALATYHRTAYSNALEALRNGWDEDGDGTIDNVQSAASMGGGVGG